jgi:cytochrome c oxidase subunit 4
MADLTKMAASEIAEEHAAEAHAPYLKVWFVLAILTLVEYFYAYALKEFFVVLLVGLLFWAVIKAGLVGWFFMHLKFEGNWVYILIVPAFVLATILVLALTPDMAMQPETEENPGGESSFVAPAPRSDALLAQRGGPARVPPIAARPNNVANERLRTRDFRAAVGPT